MKLLAVDTSGPVCGVAILTEDGIRHECAVMNHKTHSVNLLPMEPPLTLVVRSRT